MEDKVNRLCDAKNRLFMCFVFMQQGKTCGDYALKYKQMPNAYVMEVCAYMFCEFTIGIS